MTLSAKCALDLLTLLSEGVFEASPWQRFLDCAVLRRLHEIIEDSGSTPVDTVRGVFQEGPEAYPGSAFREKTHIQIAVTNPDCIKAVFRV